MLEYSSNYSEARRSMWFYSKDKTTNFNNNIPNTDNFKSFKYKAEWLGNTEGQPYPKHANGVLKNGAIAVTVKYLSNFRRSLEMIIIAIILFLLSKTQNYMFL